MRRKPWVIITEVKEVGDGIYSYQYEKTDAAPEYPNPARMQREAWLAVQELEQERWSATIQ